MMREFIQALTTHPILLSSLIAALLASIVAGIIGSYIVVKRIVFISGSIAHSVLGGIGICLWLERTRGLTWTPPLLGAILSAILSALLIGWIYLNFRQRQDSIIAAIWSIGMALGLIFISQTPGFNVDLTNFLIGNILWIAPYDLILLFSLDIVIIATCLTLHKRFLAVAFDQEHAYLQRQPVEGLYLLLLILTSISIVFLIKIVGIILVIALLTIPAAIANLFTGRLSHMMGIAILLSSLFSFVGMAIAYTFDWPAGATIALLASSVYFLAFLFKKPL